MPLPSGQPGFCAFSGLHIPVGGYIEDDNKPFVVIMLRSERSLQLRSGSALAAGWTSFKACGLRFVFKTGPSRFFEPPTLGVFA